MNHDTGKRKPFLILGGTGKTGRRVAERLEKRGMPIRIGSRYGEPPFDWENRRSPTRIGSGTQGLHRLRTRHCRYRDME